jgi:Acyl-ACP thioesterase
MTLDKRLMPVLDGHPHVFEREWPLRVADIDRHGRLRLDAAARHVQDIGQDQLRELGFEDVHPCVEDQYVPESAAGLEANGTSAKEPRPVAPPKTRDPQTGPASAHPRVDTQRPWNQLQRRRRWTSCTPCGTRAARSNRVRWACVRVGL